MMLAFRPVFAKSWFWSKILVYLLNIVNYFLHKNNIYAHIYIMSSDF